MRPQIARATIFVATLLSSGAAHAQHLWWNPDGQKDATCVYGEIKVLATHSSIYYCGITWAGGYCGIQDIGPRERRTIFSVWDTTPELHPTTVYADRKTVHNRFGGEGAGEHTHMPWWWKVGEACQFFVRKRPGTAPDTTDAAFYLYNRRAKRWIHVSTIRSPNGGKAYVSIIGTQNGLNAFLENFSGQDRAAPKAALYRLWLGPSPDRMKCLVRATGDGIWGTLDGWYFLAEGDRAKLNAVFSRLRRGKPVFGEKGAKLPPIPDRAPPRELMRSLPR